MSNAAEVLVIILAAFLAVFLGLAIALIVLLLKVTKQIRTVTGAAETTVRQVNSFVAAASKAAAPAVFAKYVVQGVVGALKKKRR
ncbi:MAG: hypothetical protein EOT04_02350 [Candidatus Chaera renei]|uniref:DUF948 domain-containing protein n=1 Tax=Candidatus Chaera renei TaxID=2506947 RepID=A0A4Q0AIW8_9BACT|nr:MAG: hypothetical protein EOT04_02350 [Candidatus Chaera renei]